MQSFTTIFVKILAIGKKLFAESRGALAQWAAWKVRLFVDRRVSVPLTKFWENFVGIFFLDCFVALLLAKTVEDWGVEKRALERTVGVVGLVGEFAIWGIFCCGKGKLETGGTENEKYSNNFVRRVRMQTPR